METLKTEIKDLQNSIYCKLVGSLKGIEALNLKSEFKNLARRNKALCIDLTEVTDISLTGFNAILMSKVYAKSQDNEVVLIVSKNSKLVEHLKLTKMMDQFTVNFAAQYIMAA